MHRCRVCGEWTSFSLALGVCFTCARFLRMKLCEYEDKKQLGRFREAGDDKKTIALKTVIDRPFKYGPFPNMDRAASKADES